ncbi:thiamine diphosphokinase [Jannaschia sp. LMIT008]|uniref:thiamine diphosphokinase n=1 Tax=Jannaschia maritima TaxID=3032585 RepID=UPI0028120CC4|nr:thiamine diphosphokinase [Jannaschia sp. LMIT008]
MTESPGPDHSAAPGITLVGGGPADTSALKAALSRAPRVVAADGGADACLAHGLRPAAVVGDMDSLSPAARSAFRDVLVPVAEQNSTDFAKALRHADADFVLAVGFLGGRIDHALAVFSHLAERGSGAPAVVLLSAEDCVCLAPRRLALDLAPGCRVSLWPLGRARLRSTGLRWPLDGLMLEPAGRVGTSNRATGPVTLRCDGPCLLIVPLDALDALASGLGIGAGFA